MAIATDIHKQDPLKQGLKLNTYCFQKSKLLLFISKIH